MTCTEADFERHSWPDRPIRAVDVRPDDPDEGDRTGCRLPPVPPEKGHDGTHVPPPAEGSSTSLRGVCKVRPNEDGRLRANRS